MEQLSRLIVPPEVHGVELRALATNAVDEFRAMAKVRKLYLSLCLPYTPIYALTEPQRMHQVLGKLVSNGLRFTRIGGVTVSVKAELRDDLVSVQVEDTGIGLSPKQRGELFSGPEQGLSIARATARALGGDLTVTSKPRVGTTFTLWLPASPASSY